MFDKVNIGARFRIEILPNANVLLDCNSGHHEAIFEYENMTFSRTEVKVQINGHFYKFISMCDTWIFVGEIL